MSLDLWHQAKPIFEAALHRSPEDRAAFVADACKHESALIREVERLLAFDDHADAFFESLQMTIHPDEEGLPIPEQVGPWRVRHEIGRGGMGRVFLAERSDQAFSQRVALKVVETGAPGLVHRFRRERRILASLDHPNVARLVGGGALPDGRPYLVMEYVEGVPITEYAARLSLDARLDVFVQACGVVAYAHRQLVVHRDLKPSNILVAEDDAGQPRVKLLDFGIARLLVDAESDEQTRTGQRLLTPVYAAPEQIRGEGVTTSTDVYALGVVLYELLTGSKPFRSAGEDRHRLEAAVLDDTPTAPSAMARLAGVPYRPLRGDLDWITLKAIRKEPERRYSSVEALARDVERHRSGLPVDARRATVGYRLGSFVRRHRVGVAMGAVGLALFVGAGLLHTSRITEERNRAEASAERAERVADVLTDVLAQSDGAMVDAAFMLRILEPTLARADSDLASDPEARAAVLFALGRLHDRIGLKPRADSLLRVSLAIRRAIHRGPHEDVAASLHALGVRFIPQPDSALGYFRAATEMRRLLPQTDSTDLAWSLLQWDRMLPKDDPAKGARYADALAILQRQSGPRSIQVAEAIHEYYVHGFAGENPEEQAAAFAHALDLFRENGQARTPRTIAATYNLGLEYERMGDLDRAFPLFRQAIQVGNEVLPPGMPLLTTMSTNYGATLHEQGRFIEADSVLRTVATQTRTLLPEGAGPIGHSHYWYGRNLLALDRAGEALSVLKRAADTFESRDGPSPRYFRARTEIGKALALIGRPSEAEDALLESVVALRGTPYERIALDRVIWFYRTRDRARQAARYEQQLRALGSGV